MEKRVFLLVALVAVLMMASQSFAQARGETGAVGLYLTNAGQIRLYAPSNSGTRHVGRITMSAGLSMDAVYDYVQDADKVINAYKLATPTKADVELYTEADNSYSNLPPNVHVRVHLYGWNNDKFFLARFAVVNMAAETVQLYLGATVVPMVGAGYDGTCEWNATHRIAYNYRGTDPPHLGVALVSGEPYSYKIRDWHDYSPDPNSDQAHDSTRFKMLTETGFDGPLTFGVDGAIYNVNAGAYTLAPGDSAVLTYAVVYGDGLADLLANVQAARARYRAAFPPSRVRVTFVANTATVPDTLGPSSTVQVRGSGGPLTWSGASPVFLQNVGGDYWKGTAEFTPGERVEFKFYTNAHDTVYGGAEWEHQGWEGDVATGNRVLVVGDADTTLPLQFVNGWLWGAEQYARPWVEEPNSFVVWVRVNVQGWEDFNPAAQVIGLRGSNNVDWGQTGEISWGRTYPLVRESDHVNMGSRQYSGGYFYSGAVHVPDQYAGHGIEFKVVVHRAGAALDEDWGNLVYNPSLQNHVDLSGVDTTVHWFWFDNKRPRAVEHRDQVVVTWVADLGQAIANFGFAHGDTLLVRSGYFGTAAGVRTVQMRRLGFTSRYTATDTVVATIGGKLDYQYYKVKKGIEYREIYYNFYYAGETVGEAERRVVDPIGGAVITVEDVVASKSDIHRMPLFRNTAVVARPVTVTFTCDARPAVYQVLAGSTLRDIQGTLHVTSADQVVAWGLAMNGPATGDWGTWGAGLMADPAHRMYDDGTHGDLVAGDTVYTLVCFYSPDSNDVVGQEFKFGVGGGDNEGGYGNNHIENIDDSVPASMVASQFGSIDPVFYSAWDYDNQRPRTGVEVVSREVPREYRLGNYPNPFNPETEVRYEVARAGRVRVEVYNLLGVRIARLVDEEQMPGTYRVRWDGRDELGRQVVSGVYVCRLVAGEVVKTTKMVLVR
ncbi:MAG: T9SS type A sorting domain-containing protein [candidate division KSB1 bacterium]|jgi:hypothetical protein|nr:T9SS type A sorting domain-containing protein [candidate division KSB1 bacterium]